MTDEPDYAPGEAPDNVFDPRWGHPERDPDDPGPARYIVLLPDGHRAEAHEVPEGARVLADRHPDE